MKLTFSGLIRGILLGWAFLPASVLACTPEQDGCMGCDDKELSVCLTTLVQDVCQSSGNPATCDRQRVYDDAERHVLISTGSHMSRMRAMFRGSRKYQLH
jgi:hypothetical protein